jgi:hypothetical protein
MTAIEARGSTTRAAPASAIPGVSFRPSSDLERDLPGVGPQRTVGSALLRVTYHGWFHLGEILAIRQVLGQTGLPEFAGNIDAEAPYRAP